LRAADRPAILRPLQATGSPQVRNATHEREGILDRREFLAGVSAFAGGLLVGFSVPVRVSRAAPATAPGATALNAFVLIGPDDTVTLISNKAEMGQGVYTGQAQLIADELECAWESVRVSAAPVDPVYNHTFAPMQFTGGSTSVASSWEQYRRAGAVAREMLRAAAADTWGVPVAECRAADGRILHDGSGRALRYGELAARAATLPPPQDIALKPADRFRYIGRSVPRLDTPAKVDGTAAFSIDVRRPGQLTAVVARAPSFGAKVRRFDDAATRRIPGVVDVVAIPSGVAVVARDTWSAIAGRDVLSVDWSDAPAAGLATADLRTQYRELAKTPGLVALQKGDAVATLAGATRVIEGEYDVPYLAHAPMEPLVCVVEMTDDGCDIWAGTQFQSIDRTAAARVAGLPEERVRIHTTYLGGGFGRRANPASDFVVEAVELAKRIRRPVRLQWTREDDVRGGWYRPQFAGRIRACLGADGRPLAWQHVLVGQSIQTGTPFEALLVRDGIDVTSVEGAVDLPYDIANVHVELHTVSQPVPVQWWRSVGHSHTAFVVESFIDELATAAGRDPLDFRRQLLASEPRHLAVLDLVARHAGWSRPVAAGRARGLAVHASFGSVVAQIAEVSLTDGKPRVERVVCAVHCGRTVNPGQVEAQMQSAIVYGLSAALYGEITLADGRIEQQNFDGYRVARMSDVPGIEVHIVPSDADPTGVGEPGTPPIAPAVANALAALTGQRARRLPLSHHDFTVKTARA
jgi:isoquinoline 1-oxidoreductase subunit beta